MTVAEEIMAALSAASLIDEFEMLSPNEQYEYLRAIDQEQNPDSREKQIDKICRELADKSRP